MTMPALKITNMGVSSEQDAFKEATSLVKGDLEKVNALLLEQMNSPVNLIPQLASYLIAAGGKRIRPVITLLSAKMCGYGGIHHLGLAACVELIHAATLLHDDVVD